MSEAKQDGGRAFPAVRISDYPEEQFGMSLRQWYAGMALPEVLRQQAKIGLPDWQAEAAWSAYSMADAMIREGQK